MKRRKGIFLFLTVDRYFHGKKSRGALGAIGAGPFVAKDYDNPFQSFAYGIAIALKLEFPVWRFKIVNDLHLGRGNIRYKGGWTTSMLSEYSGKYYMFLAGSGIGVPIARRCQFNLMGRFTYMNRRTPGQSVIEEEFLTPSVGLQVFLY